MYAALARAARMGGHPSTSAVIRAGALLDQSGQFEFGRREGGAFSFDVVGGDGEVTGSISASGRFLGEQVDLHTNPCPVCLARGVFIATPGGPVAVDHVRVGMTVWSVDDHGRRIRATVLRTRTRPADGLLLRIRLDDGRSVFVSPAHPAIDGRPVGELRAGDLLDGAPITTVSYVRYRGFTYDLLPSGPTGDYLADGILLGSTLAREPIS
jgi:hypothetical protein